jgi:outer membrane protein assembly factor BamA
MSMFGVTAQYTTTNSLVASLFARTSFGRDHHRVIGILAYGNIKNDYDDYLGTGQPLKTNDDLRAFAGRYLYRFKGDWFVGGQLSIANYQVFGDSEADDLTLDTLGVTGFNSVGLGAVMMHDSRDNQDMPTRGWFGNLNNVAYREGLGGDDSFDAYRLDVRAFFEHGSEHVFALRQFNQFTVDAPAGAQATVQLRGYKFGQYLAKNMSSVEAEERFHIAKRWGATIFLGGAWLYGGEAAATSSEGFYPSYGAGFQFIIKPVQRMLASLEYAHGDSDNYGIYLKLGYAW